MTTLEQQLRELVIPVFQGTNFELVDLEVRGKPGSQVVRIYADRVGGITLDECERLSRAIADELDMADPLPGKYRLEVSSPGMDRPLVTPADFSRNWQREVRVTYVDQGNVREFRGVISRVTQEAVKITGPVETREIPFTAIKKGKLSLPW